LTIPNQYPHPHPQLTVPLSLVHFDGQDSRPYRTHIQFLRKVLGKQENSGRPSVFILLKSNYGHSRLRPGNSVHLQRLAKLLIFISFYFSMSFQSSRIPPLIIPYQPPPASHSPIFCLIFHPKPYFQPKNPDFPSPTFFAHCLPNWYSTSICEKSQPRPSRPAGKSEEPRTMRIGYVDYSRRNL